ncbi:hypothetical protein BJX62DRAFT_35306 [Aspergillus germanicus]
MLLTFSFLFFRTTGPSFSFRHSMVEHVLSTNSHFYPIIRHSSLRGCKAPKAELSNPSLECSKPAEELTQYLAPYLTEFALPLQWITARISGTQGGVLLLEEMQILSATVSISREIFTKALDGDGVSFVRSMFCCMLYGTT